MEQTKLTGYPSIDKPWLKYYSEEAINAPLPECTIYEYLWENNKDYPDDIALIFENQKITYRDLFRQIDRTASAFASIGVKEGDVVTLMVLNQPETVYCLYALNKIGAISCMINVLSSPKEIVHYMEECDSEYLIALDALFEKAYAALRQYPMKKLIYLPLYQSLGFLKKTAYRMKVKEPSAKESEIISWDAFLRCATGDVPSVKKDCRTCAIIGHTGGTTGTPKGVMLSDFGLNAIPAQCGAFFGHSRQEKLLDLIVPHATYSVAVCILIPLALGLTDILIPRVNPETVDRLIMKYRPNYIPSIPLYWRSVINSKVIRHIPFLKWASCGGAGFSESQIEALNHTFAKADAKTNLMVGYGLTEVCSLASVQSKRIYEMGSIGISLPKNNISVFDADTLTEKKYNELGEICIQSPSVMLGYVRNETETKEMLRIHSDGSVWVHTGDVGYINENGSVFIKGRMKRIYLTIKNNIHGKIFPDRVEKLLNQHPAVSDCCVVCVPGEKDVNIPIAYCESNSASENIEAELLSLCKEELPEYAVPARIVFLPALPRTAMGKIDYRALEERAAKEA